MTDKNQNISALINSIEEKYERIHKKAIITSILLFCSFILIGTLLLQLIESTYYLSAAVKTASLLLIVVASGYSTWIFQKKREFRGFNYFSKKFLKRRRSDGENISNLIDLYTDGNQKSSVFYDAALTKNLELVNINEVNEDLNQFTVNTKTHKQFLASSTLLIFFAGAFVLSAIFNPDGLQRTAKFWSDFEKPNPFQFTIEPGSTTIEHGQSISPKIIFHQGNQTPENVYISLKTDVEEEFRERPMNSINSKEYIANEIELTNSIEYYITMDEFKSELYQIDVQLQPRFEELSVKVIPPDYTQLSDDEYEYPFSDLGFYPGSIIEIEGKTNKQIDSLNLITESSIFSLDKDSLSYFHRFTPKKSDTLYFEMVDNDGLENRNPFRIVTQLQEDEFPIVVIQEPNSSIQQANPDNIDVIYQATDDFGLTSAELKWEIKRAFVDQPISGSTDIPTPQNGRSTLVEWDLSDKELRPRDVVQFWIRALDNDEVGGYKWGESQRITLSVPSLADSFEEMESKERDVQSDMDNISDSFEQMEEEYERFIERLRENPDGGFEEQEMLEDVTERQRDIDNAVKEMKEQFDELQSEMNQSNNVSDETRQSYQELQQLMDELDDPDLQKALDELRKAMENMSPEQMEEALENVTFNEELYRERLERTKELFKQIKMNADLDRLAQQYDDLSERTKEDSGSTLEQLQQELEAVEEDMDQVSDQLESLDSNPPKRSEEQLQQVKEDAQNQLNQIKEQLDELQKNTSNQMENGESSPSEDIQQQQQQISEKLKEEADKFRESVQQMSGQQIQINILALQRSLYTLLELSEAQEDLSKRSEETQSRSQGFVELARQQNYVVNQFSAVADSIFEISSELPQIPNEVNRKKAEIERVLQRSINEMTERDQRGASITSRESLGGINDLSSMIASLLDQLMDQDQNGGSGGGSMSMQQMIENMKKMSGEQQQLNQQLQNMVNDIQGDRLTREQSERLDQMARQQNEIRKQLQELQQSGALQDGDRTLSELQRMLEEMEDSINDMRGGITDPMMIERQQNILSRMLNAEESMDQRGEDEEREGSSAEQMAREFPPEMTLEELKQEIRSRLQDPNYTKFSDEYQQLIQRYFEQLRRFDEPILPD